MKSLKFYMLSENKETEAFHALIYGFFQFPY